MWFDLDKNSIKFPRQGRDSSWLLISSWLQSDTDCVAHSIQPNVLQNDWAFSDASHQVTASFVYFAKWQLYIHHLPYWCQLIAKKSKFNLIVKVTKWKLNRNNKFRNFLPLSTLSLGTQLLFVSILLRVSAQSACYAGEWNEELA